MERALVTGAGGFIGHHLVRHLKDLGYWVRGVDLKHPAFEPSAADEFHLLDLRRRDACDAAVDGVDDVYSLAAEMGGIGFITSHHASILHDNALIDMNMLDAARSAGVARFLYPSSACVYPEDRQATVDAPPLRESDAYPAMPSDAYGWEKLMGERAAAHYRDDYGLSVRIVRFHNVYGPLGAYEGGREKAPAALCRKVALARPGDDIEIWGDGAQTRSFCYVDDTVDGIHRLMLSDHQEPINLGSDRMVSIDELARTIISISGKPDIGLRHVDGPQGVRGRNSDNSKLVEVLGWEPETPLETGIASTYEWVAERVSGS